MGENCEVLKGKRKRISYVLNICDRILTAQALETAIGNHQDDLEFTRKALSEKTEMRDTLLGGDTPLNSLPGNSILPRYDHVMTIQRYVIEGIEGLYISTRHSNKYE